MSRYPLEPLRSLRESEVDAQAQALGEATERRRDAERRVELARRVATERELAHRELERVERERLEVGGATAADLAAGDCWRERAAHVEAELRERAEAAEDDAKRRQALETQAREQLAERQAAAQAVERHRADWVLEAERRAEIERDDEANELWAHRHHARGDS